MSRYQRLIDQWHKQAKWSYWSPLSCLASLQEECGELAAVINELHGDKKPKTGSDGFNKEHLQEEMGDVVYALACLATVTKIDLDEALHNCIDRISERDKTRY